MVELLAQNNFGDTRDGGLAGPTGLVIILLLVVATIFLIRNMNARLRRLPDRFPDQRQPTDPAPVERAVVDPAPVERAVVDPTDRPSSH